MSHTDTHIIFNDQTSPGSNINEQIAEMTANDNDWPAHAGDDKVNTWSPKYKANRLVIEGWFFYHLL